MQKLIQLQRDQSISKEKWKNFTQLWDVVGDPWQVNQKYKVTKLISNNIYIYLEMHDFRRKIIK